MTVTPTELVVVLVASLPWLAGAAVAVAFLVLLRRLVRATERLARAHEAERRDV